MYGRSYGEDRDRQRTPPGRIHRRQPRPQSAAGSRRCGSALPRRLARGRARRPRRAGGPHRSRHRRIMAQLGAAATQTAGLVASFGTMAKPFHAGKAAMDGVVAAQLAANGFETATGLLEPGGGLDDALVQDRTAAFAPVEFAGWNILDNSFK